MNSQTAFVSNIPPLILKGCMEQQEKELEPQQVDKGYIWKGYQPFCTTCGLHLNDCRCNGERYEND